jgi:Flp pilus assembly protein TadG
MNLRDASCEGAMMSKAVFKRRGRREAGSRRGATIAEFALTVPIFFLFLMAAFEFGWLNVIRHTADNAAYEAARPARVPGGTAAEARTKANKILSAVGARNAVVTVSPSVLNSSTKEVTVTIDVPVNDNALVFSKFTRNGSLHSTATMRTERAQ